MNRILIKDRTSKGKDDKQIKNSRAAQGWEGKM